MTILMDPLAQPVTEFTGKLDYELGEKIDKDTGIIQDCSLTTDSSKEKCSAMSYEKYEDAERCMEAYRKYEGEGNVAKVRFVCRDKKGGRGGVVLLEPLTSFHDWLNQKGKMGMWEVNDYTECIGLGPTFKKVFHQIGATMIKLNSDRVPHKNLKKGIMFGQDGNIRICNFFLPADVDKNPRGNMVQVAAKNSPQPITLKRPSSSFVESSENKRAKISQEPVRKLKWTSGPTAKEIEEKEKVERERSHDIAKDITDFIDLVIGAAEDCSKYTCFSDDINLLKSMRDFKKHSPVHTVSQMNEIGVWIYNSIFCWNIAKVLTFIFLVDSLSFDNKHEFNRRQYLSDYMRKNNFTKNWGDKLRSSKNLELIDFYDKGGGSHKYADSFSVLRLCTNYIVHRKPTMTEEDACRFVLRVFPDLVGKAYVDFFSKMRGKSVDAKTSEGPVKYHGKMFDEVFKRLTPIFNMDEPF
ncbi:hypothetical protein P3S67_004992 [Capsicum chacoense]